MIQWMRFKWLYFLISALFIVPGLISLFANGLRPAIDFTGGSLLEYQFENGVETTQIKSILEDNGYQLGSVQLSGEKNYLLRLAPLDNQEASQIKVVAILLAAGFIIGYVTWRFKESKFGVCAILAMFHDTLVLLGAFSLLGYFLKVEVDTLFVTAVLTVLSFSVHDTIVVYDRIRESQKLFPKTSFQDLANKAITETLSRSLNNSLTIIFMLVALFLMGGVTIRWFVAALLIGTVSGTYSSTFNAVPLLVVWDKFQQKRKK